jgi:hypothetical protein
MKKKASFEYDPADIPKLKSELDFMLMQIRDEAYEKGLEAERERIIKLIREVVSEHHARNIDKVPSVLLIQLIEKGTK